MSKLIPEQIKQHPIEYLILVISLLISAISFLYYSFDPHIQRRVVYMTASVYFLWSLYHHYRRGDLQISIVIEYLAMAILGVVLLTSTLL